jgi:nitrite reductase/ring-hydroxylating ferredoxin subunit
MPLKSKNYIADIQELIHHPSKKFRFKKGSDWKEGFVVRFGREYFAYLNRCQHVPLPLDLGDNDFFDYDEKRLMCRNHGAVYLPDSGECIGGPCVGQFLEKLPITQVHDRLYVEL